jgi:hypothetical protein
MLHRGEKRLEYSMIVKLMTERCRQLIAEWDQPAAPVPPSLLPTHLTWMCDQITSNSDDWPATKLHRWIGFVQAGMIANHMLDLADAKTMFDTSAAHTDDLDQDLIDHLDPDSPFRLDIGGQG